MIRVFCVLMLMLSAACGGEECMSRGMDCGPPTNKRPQGQNIQVGPCPAFTANPNQLINNQQALKPMTNDGLAKIWTVQIGAPTVFNPQSGQPAAGLTPTARYFVQIDWSNWNGSYTALVDAVRGTQFEVYATELVLKGGVRPSSPNPFTGPGGEGAGETSLLPVSVCEGCSGSNHSPTFTRELSTFAGDITSPIAVPSFARSVEVAIMDSAAAPPTYTVIFQSPTGDTLYETIVAAGVGVFPRKMVIPNGCTQLSITHGAQVGFLTGVAIFHLDLGGGPV